MQQKKIVVTRKNEQPTTTVTTVTQPQSRQAKKKRTRRGRNAGQTGKTHPYILSLLNPDGVRGASIPDTISMATGTYSYVLDFTQGCDSSGKLVVFLNPKMFLGNAGTATVTLGAGLITGTGATATSGYGSVANPLVPQLANNPDLSNNVERFRVVSAELQAWSASAPVNISGRVCSALLPSDFDMGGTSTVGGFIGASALPNARTTHFIEGGRALYLPGGPDDLLYAPCANDYNPIRGFTLTSGQYHGSQSSNVIAQVTPSGPTLCLAFDGLVPSSSVCFRAVINIQYQPASNNAFVQLEPVDPNPQAMFQANRLASVPRMLQGFYETHAETFAAMGSAIGRNIMPRIAGNAMSAVTNALFGSVAARGSGGQLSGRVPPRLM